MISFDESGSKADQNSVRWPAEWEPHAGTWLTWPSNPDTWPTNLFEAQREFAELVELISKAERVFLVCGTNGIDTANRLIGHLKRVEIVEWENNDAWMRDYGPTFVKRNGKLFGVDWSYDAWGGKYPPFDLDAGIATKIARRLSIDAHQLDVVVEGGAIEGNGAGILMTTKSCLLNSNRNGRESADRLDSLFRQNLGARDIWWLSGGDIAGDDTDGHIDQIARFVDEKKIVIASEQDRADPNYATLQAAKRELKELAGSDFDIVDLPMPRNPVAFNGVRLPASYANFYFMNEVVIVPQFGDPNDEWAISILKELIPGEIIGLPSRNLVVGLGSFHCLTQQQPA